MDEQVRPPHWENIGPLCTDINGKLRGGVEDIRRNMQLIVFAISDMLTLPPKKSSEESKALARGRLTFTEKALEKYRKRQKGSRKGTEELFTAFLALAWSQKHTLARCRRSGDSAADGASLDELDAAVLAGRAAVAENWPDDFCIPNFLTGRHYKLAVELFGVGSALSLCMEEMNHNLYKLRVLSLLLVLPLLHVLFLAAPSRLCPGLASNMGLYIYIYIFCIEKASFRAINLYT